MSYSKTLPAKLSHPHCHPSPTVLPGAISCTGAYFSHETRNPGVGDLLVLFQHLKDVRASTSVIFLGLFLTAIKRLPHFIHCACNQRQKKDWQGWLINFSDLESKTSSEGLPFVLQTCPYVTEATCGSYTSHPPAARKAGKVRTGYHYWLPCTTSRAESSAGMADGRNESWVDSRTCYAVFWFTRLHPSLSFIRLSTICCCTHTVLFIALLPAPHTTVKLKHE